MATITTRAGKGSPLTNTEVDNNFTNINTELGQKESASNKGVANGYASLDGSGKVPSTQLPSYVDDVVEGANLAALPATGETGKIYVTLDTNKTYRWSGSAYVEISASPGSTDAVTEGSTNLYFTNARARAAVSASGSLSYSTATGIFSYTQPTNVSAFTNDSGYLTGITGTQVANALGYTPPQPNGTGASGTWGISITGNAGTATTLQTARTINGTSFNGSANITTASWGTARTLTIGATGKSVDGSGNVSWTLGEIGAVGSGNTMTINAEYSGTVAQNQTGWYTIASYGSGRAEATFHLSDQDSSRHNYVRANIVWSYGYGGIVVDTSGRHGVSTIRNIRLLYNTSDRTYGGVKVQVYCEGTSDMAWTLRVRQETTTTTGWGNFTEVTPVLEGTPAGWAEGYQAYYVNEQGQISTSSSSAYFAGNLALHAGNYSSYALPLGGGTVTGAVSMTADAQGYASPTLYVRGDIRAQRGTGGSGVIYFGNSSGTYLYYDGANYFMPGGQLDVNGSRVLNAGNYNSYSPTLTGTGASGTWGINITGNAATATSLNFGGGYTVQMGDWGLRNTTPYGWIQLGPANTSHAHIYTNLSNIYFNVDLYTNGYLQLHSANYSSYALPLSGGTLSGTIYVGTSGSGSSARALRVGPSGGSPGSFGSYSGSWRSTIEIWDNAATRMLFLAPPDGTNFNYSYIKSTDAGLLIDVGSGGGTNAINIGTNGVANFPQGLQQGGNQVLHAGNWTNYISYSYSGWPGYPGTDANTFYAGSWVRSSFTYSSNAPHTGTIVHFPSSGYDLQLNGTYGGQSLSFRNRNGDNATWNTWRQVLHDGNYTSYSPSLTGSGASGTWGINITGNASTVGGLAVHSGTTNNGANQIVRTNGSGYCDFGWIYTISGDSGIENRLARIYSSYDNYLRYSTLTDFKVHMGLSAKSNYSRRIDYTSDGNYHVGSMGHGGYGANEVFHGGSGFIDVWSGTNYPSNTSHIQGFNALHYTTNSLGSTGGNAYGIQVVGQYNQGGLLFSRGCSGGSFSSWRTQIDDNNYSSYALPLSGGTTTGRITMPSWTTSGRNYSNEWIEFGNYSGLYSPLNGAHFYPNNTEYGSWRIAGSRAGWHGIYFDSGANLMMNSSEVGFHRAGYGWMMWWSGGTGYVHKGNPGGGTQATILDSSNYANYTIPIGGGWYGSGLPGSRWYGYSVSGGEFVLGNGLPNAGQVGVLIDGCYVAGENNGFWSMASDNTWGSRRGMYWDGTYLNFTTNSATTRHSAVYSDGNVTAYSDERVKTNWRDFGADFIERLAQVKSGIYDRTDVESLTQVGVTAQSLRPVMEHAVVEGPTGELSVAYGNAALVSAVELAKEIVNLKREIEMLKTKLH